ncbi:hypothetical protein Tco_1300766 [Tanacetum coccineum]
MDPGYGGSMDPCDQLVGTDFEFQMLPINSNLKELSIEIKCPTPFRFFTLGLTLEVFDKMVEDSWKSLAIVDSNELNDINSIDSLEAAQKSKVCWDIRIDKNIKFFHGILNSKRSQLAICGTLVDGEWIVDLLAVKSMFLKYFSTQFSFLVSPRIFFVEKFTNRLSLEQQADLE